MNPSVHLSRAFGYRELGMYDQSFLELEEIQGDEKWSFEVLEAKYLTCKAAKKWGHVEAYSNGMRIYHPNRIDGWLMKAEALYELEGAEKAVEALLLDEERFKESAFDSAWDSFYKLDYKVILLHYFSKTQYSS